MTFILSPLDAGFHHVAGHQLQPLLQMFSELGLRPVEVHHKHLQGVQLPEQILGGGRAVTMETRKTVRTPLTWTQNAAGTSSIWKKTLA